MKTVTIKQPYASLIATGHKRYEIRSWATKYRGPLLIHSSKIPAMKCELPHGCTICVVSIVDVVTFEKRHERHARVKHSPGLHAWVLENPQPVENLPMKGKLMLFDPPDHIRQYIQSLRLTV